MDHRETSPALARALAALEYGPQSVEQVAKTLGISPRAAASRLHRLCQRGRVERCGRAARDGRVVLWGVARATARRRKASLTERLRHLEAENTDLRWLLAAATNRRPDRLERDQ